MLIIHNVTFDGSPMRKSVPGEVEVAQSSAAAHRQRHEQLGRIRNRQKKVTGTLDTFGGITVVKKNKLVYNF